LNWLFKVFDFRVYRLPAISEVADKREMF